MSYVDRRSIKPVTVITPSLPERRDYRQDAIDCVAAQKPSLDGYSYVAEHLVCIDYERAGVVATLNRLWPLVKTEWVQVLADDDLLDSDYFRKLFRLVAWNTASDGRLDTADYDVYYAYCRVLGRPDWNPNEPFDEDRLRTMNTIPATALIRRSLIEKLGGWSEHPHGPGKEDWDFWLRALDAGARFRCLRSESWTYRFHGSNLSTT